MNWLQTLFGGGAVKSAIDLAGQYIEDKDERNKMITRLVEMQAQEEIARLNAKTIPWVDAVHKMMRPFLWLAVIGVWGYCKANAIAVDLDELTLMAAGPGVYTILKGRGR